MKNLSNPVLILITLSLLTSCKDLGISKKDEAKNTNFSHNCEKNVDLNKIINNKIKQNNTQVVVQNSDAVIPVLKIFRNKDDLLIFKRSIPLSGISFELLINQGNEDKLVVGPDCFWRCGIYSTKVIEASEFTYGDTDWLKKVSNPQNGIIDFRQHFPLNEQKPHTLRENQFLVISFGAMQYGSMTSLSESWMFQMPRTGQTVNAQLKTESIEHKRKLRNAKPLRVYEY